MVMSCLTVENFMNERPKKGNYQKSLGLFELVSLAIGGTIGSGIFIVPGIVSGIAGPSSIIAWIFALTSASCVAHSLARASYKYPSTGAFYSIFFNDLWKKGIINTCFFVSVFISSWNCCNRRWNRAILIYFWNRIQPLYCSVNRGYCHCIFLCYQYERSSYVW